MEKHHIWGGGGGEEILLVTSCPRNSDKLRPDGPLWLVCQQASPYKKGREFSKPTRTELSSFRTLKSFKAEPTDCSQISQSLYCTAGKGTPSRHSLK